MVSRRLREMLREVVSFAKEICGLSSKSGSCLWSCFRSSGLSSPKAPCSSMVYTSAIKGLPCHYFGAYVYTIKGRVGARPLFGSQAWN